MFAYLFSQFPDDNVRATLFETMIEEDQEKGPYILRNVLFSFRQKTKTTTQTNRFGAAGPVK
jgi:hypothetical protein